VGDILTVYKLFPEEIEDTDRISEFIKNNSPGTEFRLNTVDLEPIGFGLSVVKVSYVFSDKVDGLLDKLENFLKGVSGVNEIEVITTTLI
jgi:translation elongation factor EF-1beta